MLNKVAGQTPVSLSNNENITYLLLMFVGVSSTI